MRQREQLGCILAALASARSLPTERLYRATNILNLGKGVTAREVVNVLGRWETYKQWEAVGQLAEFDRLFDADGTPLKPLGVADSSDPRITPQRRGFCLRRGLVQRYWLGENVGRLPFYCKALAASVGCTVAELNAEPINPQAVEVVFDGLSQSRSGIIQRELCDARRASYTLPSGGFDQEALQKDLDIARRTVVVGYSILPGIPYTTAALLFIKLDGWGAVTRQVAASGGKMIWDTM